MLYYNVLRQLLFYIEGSDLDQRIRAELQRKALLKDIEKAGKDNTSQLESFYSLINHYAPKMLAYSHDGIKTRCC
jgi:hypothetical protein